MPGMRAVGLWRRWMRRTSQVAVLMWHYVSFTSSGLTIFTLGPNQCAISIVCPAATGQYVLLGGPPRHRPCGPPNVPN